MPPKNTNQEETVQEDECKERSYQTYLIEITKKQNIIACLPTGSGKTFIALQLTKFYLADAIKENKKIVFLANTVPLVNQQAEYFRSQLSNSFLPDKESHHVECLTGDRNVDVWKNEKWNSVLSSCTIIVMTSQIFVDAIGHDYISFQDVKFLVLDECHHADKDHAMNRVMNEYRKAMDRPGPYILPRVLGLTATIINGKKTQVKAEVEDVEFRLCAKALTYHKYEEVLKHSTNASIDFCPYSPRSINFTWHNRSDILVPLEKFAALLREFDEQMFEVNYVEYINHKSCQNNAQVYTGSKKTIVKKLRAICEDVIDVYKDLGPYCANIAAMHKRGYILTLPLENCENELVEYFFKALDTALLTFICKIEGLIGNQDITDQVKLFISDKLAKLLEILAKYKPNKKTKSLRFPPEESEAGSNMTLCGIIFVEKRITAQVLSWFLQDISSIEKYNFLKPSFVVGSSRFDIDVNEMRVTTKEQARVLREFRLKNYNLLIATKVIEEGLNVPSCNVIVRFDKVLTYPSYVQSMGRARDKNSKFVAFINEEEEAKQKDEYKKFQEYNVNLSEYLKEKALHADEKEEDHDEDQYPRSLHQIIPDFEPKGPGKAPRITALESISIATRYCQTLSCDRLVTLAPLSWWEPIEINETKMFKAYVQFPSNSVIREVIQGDEFSNKTLAKRSAFLKACKRLYELDVLDEKLFPKPRTFIPAPLISRIQIDEEKEQEDEGKKIGSRQRTQQYPKKIPECFKINKILPGNVCRVYQIVLQQHEAKNDEVSTSLYQFSKRQFSFGFLTPIDWSMIQKFMLNVCVNLGFFTVSLKEVNLIEKLNSKNFPSQDQLRKLREFQRYIFGDLLNLKCSLMKATDDDEPFLIVPLRESFSSCTSEEKEFEIPWDLMEKISQITDDIFSVPDKTERSNFSFNQTNYEDAVVIPWYREEKVFYTVLGFWDKTPKSAWPHGTFKDFGSYFIGRYPVVEMIQDEEQLLLKSKPLGKRLNFFTTKASFLKTKQERKEQKENIVELVPELTKLYPLPCCLYVQSKFLPSVIQRIYRCLCARDIQQFVAKHTPWATFSDDDALKGFKEELDFLCDHTTDNRAGVPKKIKQDSNEISNSVSGSNGVVESQPLETLHTDLMLSLTDEQNKQNSTNGEESSLSVIEVVEDKPIILIDYIHPKDITHQQIEDIRARDTHRREERERRRNQNRVDVNEIDFEWIHEKETKIELADPNSLNIKTYENCFNFSPESQPSLYTIMQAITMEGSHDYVTLERLEMIGDSFLKFSVSRHLFAYFEDFDEGKMTQLKSQLISNAHLYSKGKSILSLGEYLAGGIFFPAAHDDGAWLPPGFQTCKVASKVAAKHGVNDDIFMDSNVQELESMSEDALDEYVKERKNRMKHTRQPNLGYTYARVQDKSVADCVEALIGAYYTSGGEGAALHFMEKIGLRGPTSKENTKPWIPFGVCPIPKFLFIDPTSDSVENHLPYYRELEKLLDYEFNEKWLLVEAFSHPCYMSQRVTLPYQRLEFLGDAILDFLVTDHIYNNCRSRLTPGELTDLRSALVNNVTFGSLAVRYGLHTYLLHASKPLQDAIDLFVDCQKAIGHQVTGHFKLFSDYDCPVIEVRDIDVPKVLGDVFESLAGAIYVDSGMSLDKVWRVFYRLMKNEIDNFSKNVPKSPVRQVYERFQGRPDLFIDVDSEKEDGLMRVQLNLPMEIKNRPGEYVKIIGAGKNRKSAKLGACKLAMQLF